MSGRLIDSSVLLALLDDRLSIEGEQFIRQEQSSISIITFAEISRYIHLAGKAREWNDIRARISDYNVLPLTKEVCERAAQPALSTKLALADALIYATSQEHGLTLITRDEDFKGMKNVVVIR